MRGITAITPEVNPADTLRQLGRKREAPIDEHIFARDNYFNATSHHEKKTDQTPAERLHANTPLSRVFAHVVRIATNTPLEPMETHLQAAEERYSRHQREINPLADDTHLERLITAFDGFMFDRHGYSFTFKTEAMANFARYTVYAALEDSLHEAS